MTHPSGPGWMVRMLGGGATAQDQSELERKKAAAKRVQSEDNEKRLQLCPGPHQFVREAVLGEDGSVGRGDVIRCTTCGGLVTESQAKWYKRGQTHGRKEATPVIPKKVVFNELIASDKKLIL